MIQVRRRWFKPWKVEYFWYSSAYGCALGYAWTRKSALHKAEHAGIELISAEWDFPEDPSLPPTLRRWSA